MEGEGRLMSGEGSVERWTKGICPRLFGLVKSGGPRV